jgi:hypothetical protein
MIFLALIVLPAHAPVLPDAGVLAGTTSSASSTEAVPFIGCLVMVIVSGCGLQLRSSRWE